MDHAPFIWSSYGISAVILLWAALAPLFKQANAQRAMRRLQQIESSHQEQPHDTNP